MKKLTVQYNVVNTIKEEIFVSDELYEKFDSDRDVANKFLSDFERDNLCTISNYEPESVIVLSENMGVCY